MEKDLNFLYEVGTQRFIPRTWRQFLNANFANVAEHTLRVIWLALILADMEKVTDTGKIMKMALFHDISETRTGDIHYVTRMYTDRHEDKALADMVAGVSLEKEILNLWHEYETRTSIEAKIVKDADTLDVDLELKEQKAAGAVISEIFKEQRKTISQHQLYTDSAKKLWAEIQESDPHDWHLNAPNRLTHGDWKID